MRIPCDPDSLAPNARRRKSSPRPSVSSWAQRELNRRRKILKQYSALRGRGLSQKRAAKQLGVSVPTLWRWLDQPVPQTFRCGRLPALRIFDVPAVIISQARKLRSVGISNAAAWRLVGKSSNCPRQLAEFLRLTKSIPPSFLAATKVK